MNGSELEVAPLGKTKLGMIRKVYVNCICNEYQRERGKTKQINETRNKHRNTGPINRLLDKEGREENKKGEKTCLNTNFFIMQQCKDDSLSNSFFEY